MMKARTRRKHPQIVLRDGEPSAVILDIDDYRDMLEQMEDMEDLKALERMRRQPLRFRRLEDFLREHSLESAP